MHRWRCFEIRTPPVMVHVHSDNASPSTLTLVAKVVSVSCFAFTLNNWTPLDTDGSPPSTTVVDDKVAGASSDGRAVRRRNYKGMRSDTIDTLYQCTVVCLY